MSEDLGKMVEAALQQRYKCGLEFEALGRELDDLDYEIEALREAIAERNGE